MRPALTVAVLLWVSACADPARGWVTRSDLGADWPFNVESGKVDCERGAVTFATGGRTYALNETALAQRNTRNWLDPAGIAVDSSILAAVGTGDRERGTKALISRASALCGLPLIPGVAIELPLR